MKKILFALCIFSSFSYFEVKAAKCWPETLRATNGMLPTGCQYREVEELTYKRCTNQSLNFTDTRASNFAGNINTYEIITECKIQKCKSGATLSADGKRCSLPTPKDNEVDKKVQSNHPSFMNQFKQKTEIKNETPKVKGTVKCIKFGGGISGRPSTGNCSRQ